MKLFTFVFEDDVEERVVFVSFECHDVFILRHFEDLGEVGEVDAEGDVLVAAVLLKAGFVELE